MRRLPLQWLSSRHLLDIQGTLQGLHYCSRRRRATRSVAASAGISSPVGSGIETDGNPSDAATDSNEGPDPTPNCQLLARSPRSATSTTLLPLKSPPAQVPELCQLVARTPRSPTST